ncbi:zinc metallopeptidase [Victivallis sp. Marseille-Q1083]|uniref:zinc metallopeptidase n=1 Tax=Victivallis sp. Marseille-Q1083 TaxID=2717288 RepID=UPI00158B3FD7|nr:zinc metallopeptidase [Victivallis sp. Marseille-Q1083]
MLYFDPMYLLFALPGFVLALLASLYTKSTFSRYSSVPAAGGMTGAQAAAHLLHQGGVDNVRIEMTQGFLSDHYDPSSHTLRLSPDVYRSSSLAAIGVACHEAGHALQHAQHYSPLVWRSALVPMVNFASPLSYIVILMGFLFQAQSLVLVGAILFSAAVLFALVTLPVEYDASKRAKKLMVASGAVSPREAAQAGQVLNAAFLTYVASAVSSLLILLYYLLRAGVFGGNRD